MTLSAVCPINVLFPIEHECWHELSATGPEIIEQVREKDKSQRRQTHCSGGKGQVLRLEFRGGQC